MKSRVIFKFNIEKDAKNYWECANSNLSFGYDFTKAIKPEVYKKLKGKKWNDIRKNMISILKKGYNIDEGKNKRKLKRVESAWKKIEKAYFIRLEKINKKPIYNNKFICYITTIGRCPYYPKENSFMINIFDNIDNILLTCAHELMHLQFHHTKYWKQSEKEIGYYRTHDLKEALTILLNLEFKDLLKAKDEAYPNHIELRKFISKTWKKEKDFDILINKSLKWIKENGIK